METKTKEISYFELMYLWHIGKYPKRIIYNDEVWTNIQNKDYRSRSGKLLGIRIGDTCSKENGSYI